MLAAWGACSITRDTSKRAFQKYGRAMLTSHMLDEVGASYEKLAGGKLFYFYLGSFFFNIFSSLQALMASTCLFFFPLPHFLLTFIVSCYYNGSNS